MLTLTTKAEVTAQSDIWHAKGARIALVPTMGCLHKGHLSLIHLARQHATKVIVSIFVNPTQFGPNEDFAAYPRDEAHDLALCLRAGANAVFLPTPEEMYPTDASVSLTESTLSKPLCGQSRPTHFQGVLTVVNKLLNITRADVAVFGMKDAQQLALIRRMVRDLDLPITLIPAPIIREHDGLALSSRNIYLSPQERKHALCLRHALDLVERAWQRGDTDTQTVISQMQALISHTPGTTIDYIATVDADTLEPVAHLRANTLIALAVKIGHTRLIDNTILTDLPPTP